MLLSLCVRFEFVGRHRWPEAPPHRSYLSTMHRHDFEVQVEIQTTKDRELEFHDILRDLHNHELTRWLFADDTGAGVDLGTTSCEGLARLFIQALWSLYGCRAVSVTVLEDGRYGACLTVTAEEEV